MLFSLAYLLIRFRYIYIVVVSIFILVSCNDTSQSEGTINDLNTSAKQLDNQSTISAKFIETGDLSTLQERGVIRVIIPRWESLAGLPRQGLPSTRYQELMEKFVIDDLGLDIQWVAKEKFEELIPALNAGEGDVIATNMTITTSRQEQVQFSLPLAQVDEVLVVADSTFKSLVELTNKTIAVPAGSSFAETLNEFVQDEQNIDIQLLDSNIDPDSIIDKLVANEFQATVMDSNTADSLVRYRKDFSVVSSIGNKNNIAFATRSSAKLLLQRLNMFLTENSIRKNVESISFDDFDLIKKRKTLRVITQNNPATYFVWRGQLMGFEYELAKLFAKDNGLQLVMVIPPDEESMVDYLMKGYGDLIAGSMTITEQRINRGFAFSKPYNTVSEVIVSEQELTSLDALKGLNITINPRRSYWQSMQSLQPKLGFNLIAADESLGTDELIMQVAEKTIEATVSDTHIAQIEKTFFPSINLSLKLKDASQHGWMVRDTNQELLKKINEFFTKRYRGLEFNIIYNKYFKNQRKIKKVQNQRLGKITSISPYDELVKKHALEYNFDWRLLVAQMYQESGFNPKAKSYADATGLFQVLPRTAKTLGIEPRELVKPEVSIETGIRYMDWVRQRFSDTLSVENRLWFTLAAYNAGYGHVFDAIRLAKQQGLDSSQWFGHVEKAMLLLAKKEFYKKARFGYVRGIEPVTYVRNIRDLYQAYIAMHYSDSKQTLLVDYEN